MKAKTVAKSIETKINNWLESLPEDVSKAVSNKVVVTGGSIASMFLQENVNDYDIYFKDIKSAIIVTQYYCKKWIEDNKEAKRADKVVSSIKPVLRITFDDVSVANKLFKGVKL